MPSCHGFYSNLLFVVDTKWSFFTLECAIIVTTSNRNPL